MLSLLIARINGNWPCNDSVKCDVRFFELIISEITNTYVMNLKYKNTKQFNVSILIHE